MHKATKDTLKKAIGFLEDGKNIIQGVAEHYRSAFDDSSEKTQESDKGHKLEELATQLEEHDGTLDDIINDLNDLINED